MLFYITLWIKVFVKALPTAANSPINSNSALFSKSFISKIL